MQVAPQPEPDAKGVNSDCYTVDLFTRVKIQKPAANVPEAHRQFLGSWGAGAWNDVWCHDLLVTEIHADGRVDLIEMLAPHAAWNYPATAFNRTARIDGNGNLRFAYGTERLSYRIENGKLIGERSGIYGDFRIVLVRRGVPPIPTPKPIRLAQLALAAQPGS
ncbi:MAG: hypothetical protein ACTSVG_05350 [Alphaproteobacteria bacterium]